MSPFNADDWAHWVGASSSAPLDLVSGLGASGKTTRDLTRWRWPLRLALVALVVNMVGLNIEWLRLRIVECLHAISRQALEAVDLAPWRLPVAEIALQLVHGARQRRPGRWP